MARVERRSLQTKQALGQLPRERAFADAFGTDKQECAWQTIGCQHPLELIGDAIVAVDTVPHGMDSITVQ